MTIFPSACIWNFKVPVEEALRAVQVAAFHYVDVEADTFGAAAELQALKDLGLKVSCVALNPKLPAAVSRDRKGATPHEALSHLKQAVRKAHELGARCAYVPPCADRKQLQAFGAALKELADDAARAELKLCVEHKPGCALPSAREALGFVKQLGHPNVYLLLDVGHALLSKEKPWEVVAEAGARLGYVQLSDNDGRKDRHWAPLEGRLTFDDLTRTMDALGMAGYEETIGLELLPDFASLNSGLSKSRNLLLRLQLGPDVKSFKEPESRRKH
jgi:sugar phosphate isomerase/epimerase